MSSSNEYKEAWLKIKHELSKEQESSVCGSINSIDYFFNTYNQSIEYLTEEHRVELARKNAMLFDLKKENAALKAYSELAQQEIEMITAEAVGLRAKLALAMDWQNRQELTRQMNVEPILEMGEILRGAPKVLAAVDGHINEVAVDRWNRDNNILVGRRRISPDDLPVTVIVLAKEGGSDGK